MGGGESLLYFARDFFGEIDFEMDKEVAQIVDGALATENGKKFFLDHEFTGRLSSGIVRYILLNYDVDRAASRVSR